MKRTILLSIMMTVGLTTSPSWAQERPANPGEDPNLAMTSNGAQVAATGTGCRECEARLKHGRIQDQTTYSGTSTSTDTSSSESAKKGTK